LQSSRSFSSAPKRDDVDDNNNHLPPPIKNPFNNSDNNKFEWQDPLKLTTSSLLTPEELAIQQSAHQFCQSVLQPNIVNAARYEITFNHNNMRQLGEMGMLGVTIPEYYDGCAGLGYVSYGLIAAEVERVDSSYRSAMSEYSLSFFFPPFVCHYIYRQVIAACSEHYLLIVYLFISLHSNYLLFTSSIFFRCPIKFGHVSNICLRERRYEKQISARTCKGELCGLFWTYGELIKKSCVVREEVLLSK
jgi:hypothetical protein